MNSEQPSGFLPSKKFATFIIACVLIVLLGFVVSSHFGSNNKFVRNKNGITLAENATVGDLVTQDSNSNGIPDWEESLWGLDPKGDGPTNKRVIDAKKIQNGLTLNSDSNSAQLTETDKFVRQFLSTVIALQQSGNLTGDAVANMAASVNQTIDQKRTPAVVYSVDQLQIVNSTPKSKKDFANNLYKILKKYGSSGFGTEFTIINEGLQNNATQESLKELDPIAQAYTGMAADLIKIKVPDEASDALIALANASAQLGHAIGLTESIYGDAVSGMVGVDEYVKNRTAFDQASADLAQYISPSTQ